MLQSGFAEERDIQYLFSEECSNPDNLIAMEGKGFFFKFLFVTLTMLG